MFECPACNQDQFTSQIGFDLHLKSCEKYKILCNSISQVILNIEEFRESFIKYLCDANSNLAKKYKEPTELLRDSLKGIDQDLIFPK